MTLSLQVTTRGGLAAAALGLVLVAALPPAGEAQDMILEGAGATFPAPLYINWIQDYREIEPSVEIRYDAVGSGEGIRKFVAGEVHFGASDAAMTDAQMDAATNGAVLVPATAGSVVIAYNLPGFEDQLKLSREALIGIFDGTITEWSDPLITEANPALEGSSATISVVSRRDGSGTTFALTNHLAAIDQGWADGPGVGTHADFPSGAMTAIGNDGVAGRINIAQFSLGYVEYGFAERLGLPMAAIENKAGAMVAPSPQAAAAGLAASVDQFPDDLRLFIADPDGEDAYPIVTYSWLLLPETGLEPAQRAALNAFVTWGLRDGQAKAAELGYVPLPEEVTQLGLQVLTKTN